MDVVLQTLAFERYCRAVNPYWGEVLSSLHLDRPWAEARGCWLIDDQGRRYLDLSAGFGTAIFGHRPAVLRRALRKQLQGAGPSIAGLSWSDEAGDVAERLLAHADAGLGKVQFFSTGAEAIEAAVKFATIATGRPTVLSVPGGFHGLTGVATALAGGGPWREGVAMTFAHVECLPSLDAQQVQERLARGDVAAVVLEPIQHMAGAYEYPDEALTVLVDACRRAGVLLILDEVMSGLARSGRWFAFQHRSQLARPDLVVVSKGLTGGLVPVSAVLCTDAVFDAVFAGPGRAKIHGATFAGNPLSLTCALTTMREASRIDACALAAKAEGIFRAALARLDRDGRRLQLHGRGLLLAVTPLGLDAAAQTAFWWGLRDRGVLMMPAAHRPGAFLMTPPLNIAASQLRMAARSIFEAACEAGGGT